MKKSIGVPLLCIFLSSVLLVCAMREDAQVEERPVAETDEAAPVEAGQETGEIEDNGFAPDWEAIAQRAAELDDFLQPGINRADVDRELGDAASVRVIAPFSEVRYDLITVPGYEFTGEWREDIDFEGM